MLRHHTLYENFEAAIFYLIIFMYYISAKILKAIIHIETLNESLYPYYRNIIFSFLKVWLALYLFSGLNSSENQSGFHGNATPKNLHSNMSDYVIFLTIILNFIFLHFFCSCFKYWSFSNKVFLKIKSLKKKKKKKKKITS